MKRILVTGAGGSAAANFVHSLRLADEPFYVVGADASRSHLELADVEERYLVPPAHDPGYLDALNELVEAERIELVHPQPDPEVAFLARRQEGLRARTYLPAPETVDLCQDKARLAAAVRAAGLPSLAFHTAGSAEALADATSTIVADHGRAWVRAVRGAGARASLPVSTADQAISWARYWIDERGLAWDDFMVSQFLPGREFAFQSLWRHGELVTSAARERLEYLFGHVTPSGQTSSPAVARTVHRADVNELAESAIRAVDPQATGVFCVDLKEDADGRPLVTEINAGRFFTTSNFLASAGANMPLAYVKLAFDEPLPDLARTDAVPAGLYWIRMVDMGYKLVREGEWTSRSVEPTTLLVRDDR